MITVKNRKYRLSKRKIMDIVALSKYVSTIELPDGKTEATVQQSGNSWLVTAQVVNDSLKATYLNKPWFLRIFYLKYKKFLENQGSLLLNCLSPDELEAAYNEVMNLEPKKKSPQNPVNESDTKLQKD